MKRILLVAVAMALFRIAEAQPAAPGMNAATHSVSGQFVVYAPSTPLAAALLSKLAASPAHIQLDPSLLTVSCERIKQLLWRKLDDKPSWRGKIFLNLHSAGTKNDLIRIVSEKYVDGWRYRAELPAVIERERFVRVITQLLLVEIANRRADTRCTQIPLWLVEGLSRELLASGEMEIILQPPSWNVNGVTIRPQTVNAQRPHPLARARAVLGARPPLTFEELSWPEEDQLRGEAAEVYQCSAQLFLDRLLEFKDGPACLRATIAELPHYLNWQLAFLQGFKPHFERPLDIEKWWAMQVTQFTGRELTQTWSLDESWNKLDEIIRAPVQVRTASNALPLRTRVNLQTLLRSSNGIEQAQFYRQKLAALDSLRVRVSQELVGLVDEYRQAIGAYLQKQASTAPFQPRGKQGGLVVNAPAQELIRRLDVLEARRKAARPLPQKPPGSGPENISAAFRE